MLFRETVAVYCENHTEHINTVYPMRHFERWNRWYIVLPLCCNLCALETYLHIFSHSVYYIQSVCGADRNKHWPGWRNVILARHFTRAGGSSFVRYSRHINIILNRIFTLNETSRGLPRDFPLRMSLASPCSPVCVHFRTIHMPNRLQKDEASFLAVSIHSRRASFEFGPGILTVFLSFLKQNTSLVTRLGRYRFLSNSSVSYHPTTGQNLTGPWCNIIPPWIFVCDTNETSIDSRKESRLLCQYETVGCTRENVGTTACLFDNVYLNWVHSPS
jgi:hypothetical protein